MSQKRRSSKAKGGANSLPQSRFYNTVEVAAILHISAQTLRSWESLGKVPELRSVRIGGSRKYPIEAVESYIKALTENSTLNDPERCQE